MPVALSRSTADCAPILLHTHLQRKMNGLAGSISPPGQLYVRALYDYDADDRTSLSFRQGDIIQVITQLESGWWDGVIHGVRGWFPSNYCAVVNTPFEDGRGGRLGAGGDSETEESEEEYGEHELEHPTNDVSAHHEGTVTSSQEEAAFWIPQATPDGRLFYFNTLTGESTMELPLEAPTSANETGPRDRTNIYIPDQTRPPAELMAAGYERDEETDYSETEDASVTQGSKSSSVSPIVLSARAFRVTPTNGLTTNTQFHPVAPAPPLVPLEWRVTCYFHEFITLATEPLAY